MVEPATGVRRALVLTAHPDDVDFAAAGTVAMWTRSGVDVAYCVCTAGDAGSIEGAARERVAEIRRQEQLAAAAEVGVTDVTFLDHVDGAVLPSLALRRDLTRVIRTVRPDRVLTWSPEINWEHLVTSHPDHRAVGEAALAAVYPDSRNRYAHPELADAGLEPWTVRELWIADGPLASRNHAVDITDAFAVKLGALHAHRSQTAHLDGIDDRMQEFAARTAARHGLAEGRLAEDFQVVRTG